VPTNWITLAEAMRRTGYSRSTMYQRTKTRDIQARKLAGRVYVLTPILDITR
jgi:predicted DNA-binding transcriptional regulator AlpA